MQFPPVAAKIISFILAAIMPFLSTVFGKIGKYTEIPGSSYTAMEKAGGFMAGICHSDPEYQKIKDANIGWVRVDLPFPFDANGELSWSYIYTKNELREYVENGLKVMAVTPNPRVYLEHGIDIRNDEDIPKIQEIALFYLNDYKGIVSAFQIANEMGIDRFTEPFTLEEGAKFIGVQLEVMYPLRGDILIGYNLAGTAIASLPSLMKEYHKYTDYIGADLYFGTFENIFNSIESYPAMLNMLHAVTRKPLIVAEFGYIGCGAPKTEEEKAEMLEKYGVHSEEEAKQDIDAFVSNLPKDLREDFERLYSDKSDEEKWSLLFEGEFANHIYRELPEDIVLTGYPHTPEGQAKFFEDLIPVFKNLDYCLGAFIYSWKDADRCYVCGQTDCPVETGWGLLDREGNEKPAYYAVQKAFAS
ncbi:MAG: hypothetical protein IJU45_00840 [Clostridia bacterium]|nr:hypothetical protein [Clostridia bacterium]